MINQIEDRLEKVELKLMEYYNFPIYNIRERLEDLVLNDLLDEDELTIEWKESYAEYINQGKY